MCRCLNFSPLQFVVNVYPTKIDIFKDKNFILKICLYGTVSLAPTYYYDVGFICLFWRILDELHYSYAIISSPIFTNILIEITFE